MKAPELRHDGTCSACIGGWLCKYHRLQGIRNDKPMKRLRVDDSRVASLHQLESDEFYTVDEKVRML